MAGGKGEIARTDATIRLVRAGNIDRKRADEKRRHRPVTTTGATLHGQTTV